jgi:hypothetical protein
MKTKVEAIAAHGINVFINRQLIYNYPESLLSEKGIMVIEHADFEGKPAPSNIILSLISELSVGVERLSLVTGGEIASTFDNPAQVQLGSCELIEEVIIGEDKVRSSSFSSNPSPNALSPPVCHSAHKILRRRRRLSLHRRPPGLHHADDRRSRTLPARRPLRALPDRAHRDADGPRRRMQRDADELRDRGGCAGRQGQEGAGGGGVWEGAEGAGGRVGG